MTTFQIQCFLQVAKYLNFTEAANHLFVAQSSLSRNISNLESELGFSLFIRTRKFVRLTPAGAILYKEFSRILEETESAIDKARNAEKSQSGDLRLEMIETQRSETFLPQALSLLRKKHPNIHIDTIVGNFSKLREDLMSGQVDFVITMGFDLYDFPPDKIINQNIMQLNARVALPANHPLAGRDVIDLKELEKEPVIAIDPEVSHGAYNNIIILCRENGFTPENIITANSIQDLMLKVQSGLGYAILDHNCISNSNTAIANLRLKESQVQYLTVVWKRDNLNPLIPIFTSILAESTHFKD